MLLTVDIGNTNTVLGLYRMSPAGTETGSETGSELVAHWRVSTHKTQTSDEYGVLFLNLFNMHGIAVGEVKDIIISSVVPPIDSTLRRVCEKYFHCVPLFVEPGIRTGMPMLIDNPAELGADRLVNAIAAFERYGGPCIVVDFGTATTFDVISAKGEFCGGVITPGIGISTDALFARAARLTRVDFKRPAKVIGTNTISNLQSGLFYGYVSQVDGILERIVAELGEKPHIIATGGMAFSIASDSKFIQQCDDMLTLEGLRILHERNRQPRTRSALRGGGKKQ